VKSFTEQLEMLANAVAQMGGLAEAQFANAIEAIISRLRRKLGSEFLKTKRGFGYYLETVQ